jgi:hypothetical protein
MDLICFCYTDPDFFKGSTLPDLTIVTSPRFLPAISLATPKPFEVYEKKPKRPQRAMEVQN